MAVSKNNRKLIPSGGAYTEIGDPKRFVPLGDSHCYMRDPRSPKTHHVKVGSEAFYALLDEFNAALGSEKLLIELDSLARRFPTVKWADAAKHLRSA